MKVMSAAIASLIAFLCKAREFCDAYNRKTNVFLKRGIIKKYKGKGELK